MATEVVETIGSGGDYADISSWVAGLPTDLTTQDEVRIGRLIDASDYSEASTIDISGITTDTTRYVQLEAASGVRHNGTGDGSGARYAYTGGGHAFTVGIDHFRTRWIDYSYPSGGESSDEVFRWTGTGEFWSEFVLGHDISHSGGDFIYPDNQSASQTLYTSNCLFWNIGRAACHIQSEENLTWYVYNCTGWDCGINAGTGYGAFGFSSSPNTGSVMVCKNTYAHAANNKEGFFNNGDNGAFTGSENNISYDGTAPGTNSQTGVTPSGEFQSLSGTIDLHIVEGGTLEDAGTDLSSDADYAITDDIDGETRSGTWDVGGDEIVSVTAITLTADSGTYSVTGSDADLLRDLLITGESGSYSVSGSAADLLRSLLMDGESGTYSVSGQDADLLRDLLIDAESGSYTVVGSAADLLRALLMSGDAGTYSVTGSAADLIVSTGVTLTADPGSYSVTGADADLLRSLQIEGEPGSYTVSGQPADLLRALLFSADAGDYTVSGQQADLLRQLVMSGEAGSYSVSGQTASLLRDLLFDAEAGSYEVSGEDAQLVLAGAFEALNIAVSVDQPLDLSASIDQPLDLDADVDQPLDMDVDVEPQE